MIPESHIVTLEALEIAVEALEAIREHLDCVGSECDAEMLAWKAQEALDKIKRKQALGV